MVQFGHSSARSRIISAEDETRNTPLRDSINYRRHRGACPFYRENWTCENDPDHAGGQILYQIICLMDTPPVTAEEQQKCLHSPTLCWRLAEAARRNGKNGHGKAESDAAEPETDEASSPS